MWCPSATLSVWANAWLAGRAAPDDVLDALSQWASTQSVAAYDAVAAGSAGLPWPERAAAGAVSLLQTLRTAARVRIPVNAPLRGGTIRPVLPVPGDVRGLPAGSQFAREALATGEAVIAAELDGSTAIGLVPYPADDSPAGTGSCADGTEPAEDATALRWTVFALPTAPAVDHLDLGAAEYALRSAVRLAVDTLAATGLRCTASGVADPRLLVQELLESSRRHHIPDHAPSRAVRVLESAAHVEAIITVSSGLTTTEPVSASEAQRVADAVRPLTAVVRSARAAAADAILRSAWVS